MLFFFFLLSWLCIFGLLLFFSAVVPYCNSQSRRSLFFEGGKETFIRNVCWWVMHGWSFSYTRNGIKLVHQHACTPSIKKWMAGSTLKMNLNCSTAWQVFLELVSFWKDSFFLFESYKTHALLHHLIIYCIHSQWAISSLHLIVNYWKMTLQQRVSIDILILPMIG